MNARRPGGPFDVGAPDGAGWANGFDGVIPANPHPPHHGTTRPRPSATLSEAAAGGDEEIAASAAGVIRSEIAEESAARIAGEEARAGTVLASPARRRIADGLITTALERWAHRRLAAGERLLDAAGEARVRRSVLDALFGLGGLQPLLDDPDIENININRFDEVFVRYADGRRARVAPVAGSDGELVDLVRRLAARSGVQERRFDPGAPMLNLQLPDGSRLFAVMSVSARPSIAIRRHRYRRVTLTDLITLGTLDMRLCGFLGAAVRARLNIVIAGGPGVGKTTLLIALASEIEPWERLVTIEDAFELGLGDDAGAHPDVLAWQAREANTEGEGAISQAELVRAALRASPDRVIVGEIRGPEVVSVCNVMSQGNDGSMATIHASSARGVFAKMAAYAAQGPERLSMEATNLLVASAVDLVVHLDWSVDGHRVVSGIREVVDADGRQVISNAVFAPGPDRRARPAAPARADTLERLRAAGWDPDHPTTATRPTTGGVMGRVS